MTKKLVLLFFVAFSLFCFSYLNFCTEEVLAAQQEQLVDKNEEIETDKDIYLPDIKIIEKLSKIASNIAKVL